MFYAFYNSSESPSLRGSTNSKEIWHGKIELRGLKDSTYKIVDYVHDKEIGFVHGPVAAIEIKFEDNLLLVAIPLGTPVHPLQ
jgi:hypothetical protein